MNTPKDDGGPISPDIVIQRSVDANTVEEARMKAEGVLTLRDWFAGMALQGYLAGRSQNREDGPCYTHAHTAASCYRYADAMLAARKEGA